MIEFRNVTKSYGDFTAVETYPSPPVTRPSAV